MANTSFSQMKRERATNFEKLNTELTKLDQPKQGNTEDLRFWKPDVDKAGNGFAVIRFLPAPEGEDVPFVRVWDHGFQAAGGWYIEKSLTTLGQKDPCSEYNSKLWATGTKENREFVTGVGKRSGSKRRLAFFSNIIVISDSKHPENEGKVFLYQYGKKIWDKINFAMNPEFEDEAPINPFDMWEGANFKLKIRNVEGYRNYDKSEFEPKSPIYEGDDAKLEALWKSQYSLKEFVDPKNFKSYEALQARLYKILGLDGSQPANQNNEEAPPQQKAKPAKSAPKMDDDDGDDESINFFKKLAEEEA